MRGIVDWALEGVLYAVLATSLISRARLPELAYWPMVVVLTLAACGPIFLLRRAEDPRLLSRLAVAVSVGVILQLRLPLEIPGAVMKTGLEERLAVSVTAPLFLVMISLLVASLCLSRRGTGAPGGSAPAWTAVAVTGALFVLGCGIWVALDATLRATRKGEGLFAEETAAALSIIVEWGTVLVYLLTAGPIGRLRRVAAVVALALIARGVLPPTGGGG